MHEAWSKNMIQCVTEIVPFKSFKAFCIGLPCLHMKQTSIICTGLLSVPPPEADLAFTFNPFLKH